MKVLLSILTALFLISCAAMPGMPGHISKDVSKFDNSKSISMEPVWINGNTMRFGFYHNTKMKPNEIVLIVMLLGAENRFEKLQLIKCKLHHKKHI